MGVVSYRELSILFIAIDSEVVWDVVQLCDTQGGAEEAEELLT